MKKFLVSLLWFFIPILICVIVLSSLLKSMVVNHVDFKIDNKINTIVFGHSQTESAFKDSIMPGIKNLCFGGEAYYYTYQKMKIVLEKNKGNNNLKSVIVSFTNNQIESVMNEWTYGDGTVLNYYPKYSFVINPDDSKLIATNNFKSFLKAEQLAMISNAKLIIKRNSIFDNRNFGGYFYINKSQVDSLLRTNYLDHFVKTNPKGISTINLAYLDKIVELCKKYNKNLFLIRTPIHNSFFEKLDEKKFQDIRTKHYSKIPFLDFHDFSMENKDFKDFNHLNDSGAKKFSIHFNQLLVSGLLKDTKIVNKNNDLK